MPMRIDDPFVDPWRDAMDDSDSNSDADNEGPPPQAPAMPQAEIANYAPRRRIIGPWALVRASVAAVVVLLQTFVFPSIFRDLKRLLVHSLAISVFCSQLGMVQLPFCPSGARGLAPQPILGNFPRLAEVQTKAFGQLLEGSVSGSTLSRIIKKAQMTTSDLARLVRASNLTSNDAIAYTLIEFEAGARTTGRELQKFGAMVGGAVDRIAYQNEYALRQIEDAARAPSTQPLWPAQSHPSAPAVATAMFNQTMHVAAAELARLVLAAQRCIASLDALEQHLGTLHALVARADAVLAAAHADLLAQLWTRLGGNAARLRGVGRHARLLGDLGEYRSAALAHVVDALQTLQEMEEDLEELRGRVAVPELVGEAVPVEVQMRSVRSGLERLNVGRIRAKRGGEGPEMKALDKRRRMAAI